MPWGKIISLFGLGTFKFLFAPFVGVAMKLNILETYISIVLGATLSATVTFYLSKVIMQLIAGMRSSKSISKRKFTRTNKLIIRMKWRLGIIGITFFAPLILSIPVGTAIVAKIYSHQKKAFPLIILGIFVNGFILTSLAYSKHLLNG